MTRPKIRESVRYLLWAKSAGRCHLCNEPLYHDELTQIEMNFGDVAHIIGSPKGPRGDSNLSLDDEYCNNIKNLMLLCPTHHKLIDRFTRRFSVDHVRGLKKEHEDRIYRQTSIKPDKTSKLIIYRGNIGEFQTSIDYQDAKNAMFPDYYPDDYRAIELGMSNSQLQDHEDEFWNYEVRNLERQFSRRIRPLLNESVSRNHFSIFAFAPIPLLIKLGTLLPDVYPAQVYQLHKEPATWIWQQSPEEFDYLTIRPKKKYDLVALNLSLSADITDDRIFHAMDTDEISIWKMDITKTEHPKNDHLRSKAQLIQFSMKVRKLLNEIKADHGQETMLHVFPAIPVAAAVELGRVHQQKADLFMMVYDQNEKRDGFYFTIQI